MALQISPLVSESLASQSFSSLSPTLAVGFTAAVLLSFLTVDLVVAGVTSSDRSVRMQVLALLAAVPRVSALCVVDVPALKRELLRNMLVLRACITVLGNLKDVRAQSCEPCLHRVCCVPGGGCRFGLVMRDGDIMECCRRLLWSGWDVNGRAFTGPPHKPAAFLSRSRGCFVLT